MTPVKSDKDLMEGEWYICYEKFSNSNCNAYFIGNFQIPKKHFEFPHLIGKGFRCDLNIDHRLTWNIYEDFKSSDGNTQDLFKLTDEEVLLHVLAEDI